MEIVWGILRERPRAPLSERQNAPSTMVSMTPFLRKIVFFSSGGSFLDGYVLALIGVALTQITPLFDLTETWSALIGASVFLGILIGTVVGGYLTDLIGRRVMFIIDLIAIAAFSISRFLLLIL